MLDRLRRSGALNRLFHIYWRFSRGLTLGARGMVIDREGRIFLIRHGYTHGWHMPGGGVEAGESMQEALARELREEGNIEIMAPAQLHGIFYYPLYSNRDHVAVFVVRDFRQPTPPVPNLEIEAHGFFAPDALPDGTTAGTRQRIKEVLEGLPAAARW